MRAFGCASPAGESDTVEPADRGRRVDKVALALIELELPQWQLRRLVHDDGEWICSLSKQPNLPAEFDDTVDTSHEVLSLALLTAFLEAKRQPLGARAVRSPAAPQVKQTLNQVVCCDNFA